MGFPTVTKSWVVSGNNRYVFGSSGSLFACMQAFAWSMKTFMKTGLGYTLKGSSSAGVGAMDGVDRWPSSSSVTPRASGGASPLAWVVLTNGNGVDICMSYNSSSDDVFRFAFSPGGLYVAAATPSNQPTATDEIPIWDNSTSMVNNFLGPATNDRVWHMMGSTDRSMFRCVLFFNSAPTCLWGVEQLAPSVAGGAVFNPPTWGWAYMNSPRIASSTGSLLGTGQCPPVNGGGGKARAISPSSAPEVLVIGGGGEHFGVIAGQTDNVFPVLNPELQGGNGQVWIPVTATSTVSTTLFGRLGVRIDWWASVTNGFSTAPPEMETYNDRAFVSVGSSIFPWDGRTGPVVR